MQHTRVDSLSPGSLSYHNDVNDHASRIGIGRRVRPALATTVPALAIALTLSLAGGMGVAHAKGGTAGTAKPPQAPPAAAPVQVTVSPPPAVPPPIFTQPQAGIHQFDITGFIQAVTVSGSPGGHACPGVPPDMWGGTVQVNGITIIIPCNLILQMPAAAFSWAQTFAPTPPAPPLTLFTNPPGFPSFEIRVVGNIVNGQHIAGLVLVSQQSVMAGQGIITGFDYANGVIFVGSTAGGPAQVRVQINDPRGRFSKGQTPDARFTVDDENPTIHAATGYPMCIPRVAPPQNDPECPQKNRPLAVAGCRNFQAAGVILPSGREIAPPAAGQTFCSAFVMEDPNSAAVHAANSTRPDAMKQAPFEVGDYITYAGTLIKDGFGPNASNTLSAHTIEASVGIFTQPHTLPVYLSIGEFAVSADAPATAINGAPQEAQNRLILEASVTDVTSVVDIYMIDFDPDTGAESHRWITPESMTGEANGVFVGDTNPATQFHGGITTQFTGPQPGRARLRANKAPVGLLVSPTRNLRVVARTLCTPANVNDLVNGVPCLERMPAAKGTANPAVDPLFTGQYLAPVFEYIFPENVVAGDPIVPNNLWDLGFLMNGEGPGTGPLIPTPW